jgi:hypothetical protein
MMVMMLNVLIAILSNVYAEIETQGKMELAQIYYLDYQINKPNKMFSCVQNIPFLLPLVAFPLLFLTRSTRLNTLFNYIFYLSVYFRPFLFLFLTASLLLLPFTYCFILYSILKGNYTNGLHQTVKLPTSTKVVHFLTFFVFGLVFLVYRVLADLVYIIGKTRKVPVK